jgi:aspartate beta-hydroxylase
VSAEIDQLAAQAGRAAQQGQWAQAESLWREVYKREPKHPHALYSLSMHAWQRGDLVGALELIQQARNVSPNDPLLAITASMFHRDSGDLDNELNAINACLAIDAYYLPAILAKAAYLERINKPKLAAITYRDALRIAPSEQHWPAELRDQLLRAQQMSVFYGEAMEAFLLSALGNNSALIQSASSTTSKWHEAASIMSGRSRPYEADCNQLRVPRLPAIPFFDREQFSWVRDLEAQTSAIRDELQGALATQGQDFTPYIGYNPGEPVNQWHELNHSNRWSTYQLWKGGTPVHEHLSACPKTRAALEGVEMADIDGLCPNAMFSALAPHTEIPPHHGETNARLVVHLPLIVPPKCTYRVGYEHRTWEVGKTLIFDDTIEHTARNDSDELRVVLIFDVWNPLLSLDERDAVRALTKAAREFNRD